jgi:uncharacterized protein
MPYAITFVDDPGTDRQKKASVRQTHIDYVMSNAHRIVVSGGFFPDDGDFPDGGLIVLDVERRQDAVDYIENDPFFLAGVFSNYSIRRFKKFIFDHQRVIA